MKITNAVLVTLTIGNWEAHREDTRVSQQVAKDNMLTDTRMCRLRKSLLPKSAVMKRMSAVIRAARAYHYENTHAWTMDGARILATSNFDSYMAQMRAFKLDFEAAVLDVALQYENLKQEAALALKTLFNDNDYPDANTLKGKYRFEISVAPMPASTDLLELGLDDDEASALRAKMEEDMRSALRNSNRRLWQELGSVVEKLKLRLEVKDRVVRKDTLAATLGLAELLPRVCVIEDPQLLSVANRLAELLRGVTSDHLKHNPETRERVTFGIQVIFNLIQSALRAPAAAENACDNQANNRTEGQMARAA